MDEPSRSFTGRARKRTTSPVVKTVDRLAQAIITIGGIGTIVAVSTVGLFLVFVVAPLFIPQKFTERPVIPLDGVAVEHPLFWAVDEYEVMGWAIYPGGRLSVFRIEDGAVVHEGRLAEGRSPTAWSFSAHSGLVLAGCADGWVQSYRLRWVSSFLDGSELPAEAGALVVGGRMAFGDGVVEKTPEGQFRFQRLTVEEAAGVALGSGRVLALDHAGDLDGLRGVVLAEDEQGAGKFWGLKSAKNFLSQKITLKKELLDLGVLADMPAYLKLNEIGDNAYAIWPDGAVKRYRLAGEGAPYLAEELDFVVEPEVRVTACSFLLGQTTILVGDSEGRVRGWFTVRPDSGGDSEELLGKDGLRTVQAKDFGAEAGHPVEFLAPASRTRTFLSAHEGGVVRIIYAVSETLVRRLEGFLPLDAEIGGAVFSPKGDGLFVMGAGQLHHWSMGEGYSEASIRSLFLPVWYEGYAHPQFMWQSSSASDESEPKLSLIPLIFGTLKATIYSLLFGAPIALLAAVFSSEFMNPRARSRVKPMIELMASLPSVVLGFLAALVFAPVIEGAVTSVLLMSLMVPVLFLLAALLWQLLPYRITLRMAEQRIILMLLFFPVAIWCGLKGGPVVEGWLFSGDVKAWLNGLHSDPVHGSAFGGIFVAILPLVALAAAFMIPRTLDEWSRGWTIRMDRRSAAVWGLVKFALATVVVIVTAILLSRVLAGLGMDLRKPLPWVGSFMDTYDQRNTLVVGFVMGFAIIPIIYTIAEDALSTVPSHLRSASLGAGATQWQTAVRIVIPTAMSGLFSAMMIGLGRAVGETMIVLMALGNTPVMNFNLFEGGRTLSANIAVELPEAVRNSAHYRTLFLSALALFVITFVVNSLAESVRMRFRKRAYQL